MNMHLMQAEDILSRYIENMRCAIEGSDDLSDEEREHFMAFFDLHKTLLMAQLAIETKMNELGMNPDGTPKDGGR